MYFWILDLTSLDTFSFVDNFVVFMVVKNNTNRVYINYRNNISANIF